MEIYSLLHGVKVFGFPVWGFPVGIGEAFESLIRWCLVDLNAPVMMRCMIQTYLEKNEIAQ